MLPYSTMALTLGRYFFVYWLSRCLTSAERTTPYQMTWSPEVFGPDGPWQAVQVSIGSSGHNVSLYPGGRWESHVLSPNVCTNVTLGNVCYAQEAGLYSYRTSNTAVSQAITFQNEVDFTSGALELNGAKPNITLDQITPGTDGVTIPNVTMSVYDSIFGTLPDGTNYPISVGALSLGAPGTVNQTFTLSPPTPNINGSLIAGWLWQYVQTNRLTPSNSFGLHIGAVTPKVAPSLYFGGFDQNRVLGAVSTQSGEPTGFIDLIDIGINVIAGTSPWSSTSMSGLLASGNTSIGTAVPITINPLAPYLHLPQSSCDAIAAHLPVTYQPRYGLYFWNTQDPQYARIVNSASCLSFVFQRDQANTLNLTINVPFKLLNLTLQPPLTTAPVPYFPCQAQSRGKYQLGRSFLQAAFLGANWNANNNAAVWWLAQAPGPNISTQPRIVSIGVADSSITASESDFADSWKGNWNTTTATSANASSTSGSSSTSPTSSSGSSSGLSAGAKAGIGLGAAIGVIGLGIAGVLLMKRHRSSTEARGEGVTEQQFTTDKTPNWTVGNVDQTYIPPRPAPVEVNVATNEPYELATSTPRI